MLTQKDIELLEEVLGGVFSTKAELTAVKSDLMAVLNKILKEVVAGRQEQTLISQRLSDLEDIHPDGKHSLNFGH